MFLPPFGRLARALQDAEIAPVSRAWHGTTLGSTPWCTTACCKTSYQFGSARTRPPDSTTRAKRIDCIPLVEARAAEPARSA